MTKIIQNYIVLQKIGGGQYGSVHRAQCLKTNQFVAVKVMKSQKMRTVPKLQEFISNEIQILTNISNENVIHFIELLKTMNHYYLVYQYCNGGTLEDLIKSKKFLPEKQTLHVFQQILNAFKILFQKNILHRDLKPSNILLHNGVIKVADFGFCKSLADQKDLAQTMVGSPIYMAPQVLKGNNYNLKADIWSIGVVLFEMLFGYCPFEDKTITKLIMQIDNKPLMIPKSNPISQRTETLLRRLLTIDPDKRIDWPQILTFYEPAPQPTRISLSPASKRRKQQRNISPKFSREKSKSPDSKARRLTPTTSQKWQQSLRPKQNLLSINTAQYFSKTSTNVLDKQNEMKGKQILNSRRILQQVLKISKSMLGSQQLGMKSLPLVYLLSKQALLLVKCLLREEVKRFLGSQSSALQNFCNQEKRQLEGFLKNLIKSIPYVPVHLKMEAQTQLIQKNYFWSVVKESAGLLSSPVERLSLVNCSLLLMAILGYLERKEPFQLKNTFDRHYQNEQLLYKQIQQGSSYVQSCISL